MKLYFLFAVVFSVFFLDAKEIPLAFGNLSPKTVVFYPKGSCDVARQELIEEKPALLIESNADEKKHGEFSISKGMPAVAAAKRIRIEVAVWSDDVPEIGALFLRIRDRDGEIFQFPGTLPKEKEKGKGWIVLVYEIDPEKLPAGDTWGNKEKLNRKLDFPFQINGFGFQYRKTRGNVTFALGDGKILTETE
ncbi:MAG: hypothetical protein HPZ91_03275 [Lentisphaeria bacterium]|nr:hypothetical protein [Lentisphaeria bacterium]